MLEPSVTDTGTESEPLEREAFFLNVSVFGREAALPSTDADLRALLELPWNLVGPPAAMLVSSFRLL